MSERKLDELSADLDDVATTVAELKDTASETDPDRLTDLEQLEQAVETARDRVDGLVDDDDDNDTGVLP